jgi:pantoate--beta-alanine ligase
MDIFRTSLQMRSARNGQQSPIAFVPTMGNLHRGHLALVNCAQQTGSKVVVSIFVNPLQFLPHEDFGSYPRTLEADLAQLEQVGVDAVFVPNMEEIYPQGKEGQGYRVIPPEHLAEVLEGQFRPGFFMGVCTVVLKLFNMINPQVVVMGKKDYQQWRVIHGMVAQLNMPIEVIAGETVREPDGLALSSRNSYLSASERAQANGLSQSLKEVGARLMAEETFTSVFLQDCEEKAKINLEAKGWAVDYVAIRRADNLASVHHAHEDWVLLGAAKLGKTRLIDNLEKSIVAKMISH